MHITVNQVSKVIKRCQVLDNISLEMEGGKVYGLQGINGSGKTMLMRTLLGLIYPTKGEVIINGEVLGKDISFPRSIGALIENPAFLNQYTGFENLELLASIKGIASEEQIKSSLRKVGLDPNDRRKYKKYSLGMRQRLGIACAFMEKPDVIVLDEPLNALDIDGIALVRDLILDAKEEGAIIVLACHDKEELYQLSDIIIHIVEGKVVEIQDITKEAAVDEE